MGLFWQQSRVRLTIGTSPVPVRRVVVTINEDGLAVAQDNVTGAEVARMTGARWEVLGPKRWRVSNDEGAEWTLVRDCNC